jgi:hypothetical protein
MVLAGAALMPAPVRAAEAVERPPGRVGIAG